MFRKKKKEQKIELCELWSLNHTLAKIISRYLKGKPPVRHVLALEL